MLDYVTLCYLMVAYAMMCSVFSVYALLCYVCLCGALKEKIITGLDAFALLFFGSVLVWAWGQGLLLVRIVSKHIPHPRAKAPSQKFKIFFKGVVSKKRQQHSLAISAQASK